MISSEKYKQVHIHITTFKQELEKTNLNNMTEDCRKVKNKINHNFLCSVCLNPKKTESYEKPASPVNKNQYILEKPKTQKAKEVCTANKMVQTSQSDFNQSVNLLNEVLTVFQNKKEKVVKKKTVIVKDASVSADLETCRASRWSVSKIFQFSVHDHNVDKNDKFTIITSHIDMKHIDLSKQKSSSIPQMKLEKLKTCKNDRATSKDAIEEVNRMFATVRKRTKREELDGLNRPSVRSGPRILPVVKTREDLVTSDSEDKKCRCCQTQNCMSSGDSFVKLDCCHHEVHNANERCEKCVYMLCCHYKNYRKMQASGMTRGRRRDGKVYYKHDHDSNFGDSC